MGFQGGAEKYSIQLAVELEIHNFRPHFLSLSSQCNNLPNHYTLFDAKVRQRDIFFKAIKRIAKFIDDNNVDFFICIGHGLSIMANFAVLLCRKKCNVIFHSHVPYTEIKGIVGKLSLITNYIFDNSIVTLTERDAQDYIKFFHNSEKIKTINNFVPFKFTPYALNDEIFIAVGYLSERKNFLELIDIFSMYLQFRAGAKLFIYGDGPQHSLLQEAINTYGLNDSIILMGFKPREEIFTKQGVLLMVSKAEGMPLCILESFSFGLPCIAYDCHTGPRELIAEGSGVVVPQGDKETFIYAMLNIRKYYSTEAIHNNLQRFNKEGIVNQWCSFLSSTRKNI